jgi:Asp-tRNA(Asn)/Glu-tRNA(Gln) amidotransferase A subunit family amidase
MEPDFCVRDKFAHLRALLSQSAISAYNLDMTETPWTIRGLRNALATGAESPSTLSERALASSNQNLGRNTYLWQDAAWTRSEAARVEAMPRGAGGAFGDGRSPLWGLPVSVKDCFDLAGSPTSCGVHFYRDLNGIASRDSWLVERLRAVGAVITGKTHLHPLAYGITGENPDFGDCLQPRDPTALTGGSSSGAAASVQEGSAVFAIGTDTGGSVRMPAALCGLAGYRASIDRGDWRGGAHLAESFDTMGGLFRDLEDAPLLASLFAPSHPAPTAAFTRFSVVDEAFLHDCDPQIVACMNATARELESLGLRASYVGTTWWADSYDIFAPIQASEAARVHAGHFEQIEPSIRQRLEWGASIDPAEIAALRQRHKSFRARIDTLFAEHELVLLPAAPLARLDAGADHTHTRSRILRYTTPFSLSGVPVVTIPCSTGGMQLAAAHGSDESLLQLAAMLGARRKLSAAAAPAA